MLWAFVYEGRHSDLVSVAGCGSFLRQCGVISMVVILVVVHYSEPRLPSVVKCVQSLARVIRGVEKLTALLQLLLR